MQIVWNMIHCMSNTLCMSNNLWNIGPISIYLCAVCVYSCPFPSVFGLPPIRVLTDSGCSMLWRCRECGSWCPGLCQRSRCLFLIFLTITKNASQRICISKIKIWGNLKAFSLFIYHVFVLWFIYISHYLNARIQNIVCEEQLPFLFIYFTFFWWW